MVTILHLKDDQCRMTTHIIAQYAKMAGHAVYNMQVSFCHTATCIYLQCSLRGGGGGGGGGTILFGNTVGSFSTIQFFQFSKKLLHFYGPSQKGRDKHFGLPVH